MMNAEDQQKLNACMEELAEILYRNTPAGKLEDFEGIEKTVRNHWLETIGPKLGFFYQNEDRNSEREGATAQQHNWRTEAEKKAVGQARSGTKK